ncbi:MAG: beta-ketoacyl-[acyl-carrier-protein] synthase family protein [Steroidobacteraceae bacterium]
MTLLRISHYTLSSALGHGRAAHWHALHLGQTGLRQVQFDTSGIDCYLGEVAGLNTPLPPTLNAFDCRNHRLAWLGLQQDGFFTAAQQLRARHDATRIGVFIGTSTAGIHSAELAYRDWRDSNADAQLRTLPDWFDYRHTQNLFSVADFVAQALQLRGPVMAISTACSSSAKVFAAAYRHIQMGLCDAAIVGGVDSLCLTTLYGFNSLQLVSNEMCRPADAQRKGISIGEAAGFAILEKPGQAASDALPYALLGYGESGDAHHMSSPDPQGQGAAAAMRLALQRAQQQPIDVDYINLHGTGTQANDAAEDQGVCAVFGTQTPCSSTKGFTGHTLGAAGIMEVGIGLLCIEHGFMPLSLNTQHKDPALQANVLMQSQQASVRNVLSNSFGFGGSNCSLLLGSST